MITNLPDTAMIMAAGLGTRMRPLTNHTPKPLIEVGGVSMLDRIITHIVDTGFIKNIVINAHHLSDIIEQHVNALQTHYPYLNFYLSKEESLLETGGGVVKALPLLGNNPFFVINGDIIWQDGPIPTLQHLAESWQPDHMQALLLLHPTDTAMGYDGKGDFDLGPQNIIQRDVHKAHFPYIFAGVQILKPQLFRNLSAAAFSLNILYKQAHDSKTNQLTGFYGLQHQGKWYHIGTQEALKSIDTIL